MVYEKINYIYSKINSKFLFYLSIIFILIRLVGITSNLTDYHHFRQTYTAAFAKFFYENENSLFQPNLDIINYKNVSEFQIYPYLVSILYRIFGFHDSLGRILSLIFSYGTFLIFYKLVLDFFDETTAKIASIFLTFLPLSIFYSRVFMLESMMLFLSVCMVYSISKYLQNNKIFYLVLGMFFTSLTLLIKIPTIYMLLPILYLFYDKYRWKLIFRNDFFLFGLISIIPSFFWYFLYPKYFPQSSIVDKDLMGAYYSKEAWQYYIQLMKMNNTWKTIFLRSIAEYHLAISVFIFSLGGIFLVIKNKFSSSNYTYLYNSKLWMFFYWIIGILIFILAFIAPNLAHEYYQLPIQLPCIAMGAYFVRIILKYNRYRVVHILIYILIISIIPFSYFKLKSRLEQDNFYIEFAENIKTYTNESDLIIVADNTPRTEVFYFSNRSGYQLILLGGFSFYLMEVSPYTQKKYEAEIEEYKSKGGRYFVTPYREFAGYLPWLKNYLDKKYYCILGCRATKESSFRNDKSIPGYIYDLKEIRSDYRGE